MEKLLIWLVLIGFGGLVWAVLTDRYEVARNVAKLSVTGAAALGLILLMALVIPSSWAWADAVGLVVLAVYFWFAGLRFLSGTPRIVSYTAAALAAGTAVLFGLLQVIPRDLPVVVNGRTEIPAAIHLSWRGGSIDVIRVVEAMGGEAAVQADGSIQVTLGQETRTIPAASVISWRGATHVDLKGLFLGVPFSRLEAGRWKWEISGK
jgi:hypothetical protein